eukprot:5328920-Prymnesium_polylepis.1
MAAAARNPSRRAPAYHMRVRTHRDGGALLLRACARARALCVCMLTLADLAACSRRCAAQALEHRLTQRAAGS